MVWMMRTGQGVLKRVQFWRLVAWLGVCAVMFLALPLQHHLQFTVKGSFPSGPPAEIYHSNGGMGFSDESKTRSITVQDVAGQWILSSLSSSKSIRVLRFDPVIGRSAFDVQWIELQGDTQSLRILGQDLPKFAISMKELDMEPTGAGAVRFTSIGEDPTIILPVPKAVAATGWIHLLRYWGGLLAAATLVIAVFEWVRLRVWLTSPFWTAVDRRLARVGRVFSDRSLIVFSSAAVGVYFVLATLFVGWVGLTLHQSSIGIWEHKYATELNEGGVRLGTPRAIRSDEWGTFTPWMLSQVHNGMSLDNPNLGASASAVLNGAPVSGPLLLAQPKYWGFAFLDIEHGFSWFWGVKIFGTLGALFTLLLLLTRGDVMVSIGASVAIYGSSLVQWWLSGISGELLTGFALSVVGAIYLLQSERPGGMGFGALLLSLVIPNLLMHIYPPHLVPLAYLAFFMVVGALLSVGAWERFRFNLGVRLAWLAAMFVALGWLVGLWFKVSIDTIHLMLNTVYPGQRLIRGGDLPWTFVFHGIFESWRIDDWPLPFPPNNQTAASQTWALFPVVFLVVPWRWWRTPGMRMPLAILASCFLVIAWTSVPLPGALRTLLMGAGWSLSPPWNALLGLGVGSMLLMGWLTASAARGTLPVINWPPMVLPLLVAGLIATYGLVLRSDDAEFFTLQRIALASGAVAAMVWAVHRGHRAWFLVLCVFSAVPGLMVNPLRDDLRAYLNKDLFVQAKAAGAAPDNRWAVFGDADIAQGFKSVGLTVINGSHYAPRKQMLEVLDPDRQFEEVWNRYAHVGFASGAPGGKPSFKLAFADQYLVSLDVCGAELSALGVTRVAYTYAPSPSELKCLSAIPLAITDGRVFLYRLRPGTGSDS